MKKYSVEVESNDSKIKGKLELREKEIFIEAKETILKIKYKDVVEHFMNMKGDIRLNTKDVDYTIISNDAQNIKNNLDIKLGSKASSNVTPERPLEVVREAREDVEILEDVLLSHNEFVENFGGKMITGSKFYVLYRKHYDEGDYEKAENVKNLACPEFFFSLFLHVYVDIDNSERTVTFFKNLYPNDIDGLIEQYEDDPDTCLKTFDYKNALKTQIQELMALETAVDKGDKLTYDKFKAYLKTFEEAYNEFVNPTVKLDVLLNYNTTRAENVATASNKNFKYFWLPLLLIIGMVVKFFLELFDESGIVINGGWISIIVFIVLIIWCCVGNDGRNTTCKYCGKWGALKLTSDKIIEKENSWRTKTEYRNGYNYSRQVPTRIELHEKHFICENCNNEEVRYVREEHDL